MTRDLRLGAAGFKCCCYEDANTPVAGDERATRRRRPGSTVQLAQSQGRPHVAVPSFCGIFECALAGSGLQCGPGWAGDLGCEWLQFAQCRQARAGPGLV